MPVKVNVTYTLSQDQNRELNNIFIEIYNRDTGKDKAIDLGRELREVVTNISQVAMEDGRRYQQSE